MKKLFIIIMLAMPIMTMAQSKWETPTVAQPKKQEVVSKPKKEMTNVVIDGTTYTVKASDAPYLKGAVPEENGKVVFRHSIDYPGLSAQQVYDKAYAKITELVTEQAMPEKSRVAIINKDEHTIVAILTDEIIFTKKILMLDRTEMEYTLKAECEDGILNLTIERIKFAYEEDRNGGFKTGAEGLVSDKEALNKTGNKLNRMNAKFRKACVDRMKEIKEQF